MKTQTGILLLALLAPFAAAQENPFIPTEDNSWVPDLNGPLYAESPIDLRQMNETVAGEHGFLRLSEDGRSFVRGDGEPIRFFSIHGSHYTKGWTGEQEQNFSRMLARLGVNLATAGTMLKPDPEQDDIRVPNQAAIDRAWRRVADHKRVGIYSIMRATWLHGGLGIDPGIEGYDSKDNLANVIFFSPRLQEAYRNWVRELFVPENPYTGVPLSEEPALLAFTALNEETPLFYSLKGLRGEPLARAQRLFANWAAEKYGSMENALRVWKGASAEGDDLKTGRLGLITWWFATDEGRRQSAGSFLRLQDQAVFMARTARAFYEDLHRWMQNDLGVKALLITSNFRPAVPEAMMDLENWVKAGGDIIAANSYVGANMHKGPHNWRVEEGNFFRSESATRNPLELPQVQRQVAGHPFIINETLWTYPHEFRNEAALLASIYGNVTGQSGASWAGPGDIRWDGSTFFRYHWDNSLMARWNCSEPAQMGSVPAAALIARRGYGTQDRPALIEHRDFETLTKLEPPLTSPGADFDPIQDSGTPRSENNDSSSNIQAEGTVPPEVFLMGPVLTDFSPGQTVIAPEIRAFKSGDLIRSLDGSVTCDRAAGLVILNTPQAQAVIGFLAAAGRVKLGDIAVESSNEHLGVAVVALDQVPLSKSKRVLVQLSPRSRPTGWQVEPASHQPKEGSAIEGWRITDTGKPPFRVENINGRIWIENLQLKTATVLDPLGVPTGSLQLEIDGQYACVSLPQKAFYLILHP